MVKSLTAEEEALGVLLARAGLSARAGRAFAAIARGGGLNAVDLGAALGISRQDAGDAARELELHGLARVGDVATGGRPSKLYLVAVDVHGTLASLIASRRSAMVEESRALDELASRFA